MPSIRFANLDAVRLALTSGVVPAAVYHTSVRVDFETDGQVLIETIAPLPRDVSAALIRFGATVQVKSAPQLTNAFDTWLELFPLAPVAFSPDDRPSPVLFDVADGAALPALIAETRRLGAAQIAARWLDDVSPRSALALVESPPYHSLLRAAPCAFYEQAPCVWVAVGWRHPLAEMIVPPADNIVLLQPPRSWELVVDGPFPTMPDAFALPPGAAAITRAGNVVLSVAVLLVADHATDPPGLWVLRDRPFERLRALAEQSDDRLLSRLSVAFASANGRQIAVLRTQTGRGGPPVLVLDALACRPFLRLPNLYLPVGQRLRPSLRRDAVRRLFAADAGTVVWLEPDGSGGFTTHAIPESAFRPLEQAIAYPQEHAPRSLTTPTVGASFALEPFATRDGTAPAPRRRPGPVASEPPAPMSAPAPTPSQVGLWSRIVRWFAPTTGESITARRSAVPPAPATDEPPRSLAAWEEQRRELEERLLTALNTPDGPDRLALWPQLARLYFALNRPGDAAVCWLNALWEADEPPAQWGRGWMRAEARSARGDGSDADLRRWLGEPPTPAVVRAVAALVAASDASPAIGESLDQIQRMLDEHEDWLPVRAAWLARVGLMRHTRGDVVGLARTRDRLLERLHDRGLSADLDVPAAVRFAGQGAGERVDAVRAWLTHARGPVHRWLAARTTGMSAEGLTTGQDPRLQAFGLGGAAAGPTRAYADLILAWGLARLGERGICQDLLTQARGTLAPLDAAHNFLLDAFAFRIAQALEGRSGGRLPDDLLARLTVLREREQADRAARERLLLLKTQHLLQRSRILEPDERVRAFSEGWLDPHAADHDDLAGLRYIADREELSSRLLPIVASAGRDQDRLPIVLAAALDLAPRLGEAVAGGILERLLSAIGTWTFAGPPERVEAEVTALERGLFVAAHFDRADAVPRLLTHLGRLLEARRGGDPGENRPVEDALLTVIGQGIRGLRRLGLRDEADRLLDRLGEWVAPGGNLEVERRRRPQAWPLTLRRLLALAGGWFYVGREVPATEVLDEARRVLFTPEPAADHRSHRTELACAYAAALGQAPVRLALGRVEELFMRLTGVTDNLVTNTHYSLAKLRLIEAAVRAVVTDDFALGPAVRRWLDDDEYRVRRRIHRDTRVLVGTGDA
jgi:hypothetical protein